MPPTTPIRYKAADINAMPIQDCLPFEPFDCPDEPIQSRISDYLLGKLFSYCSIIYNRKNMTAELAPISFTAKSMRIRTTGNAIGIGNAFVYQGKYVTFSGFVLRGNWAMDLPVGLSLEYLVDDADFQDWIQRSWSGDFAAFTLPVIGTDAALLESITSTEPGMIGSRALTAMGPYFGVVRARNMAAGPPTQPPVSSAPTEQQPDPSAAASASSNPSAAATSLSTQQPPLSSTSAEPTIPTTPAAPIISSTSPAEPTSPATPTAPTMSFPMTRSRSEQVLPTPYSPDRVRGVDFTEEDEDEAERILQNLLARTPVPEGWSSSHSRSVSMPNWYFAGSHLAGFQIPTRNTRNTSNDEIHGLIEEQYGPTSRDEDRLMPPAKTTKSNSNTSMGGMTTYSNDSAESALRYRNQPYVPTSPSFGSVRLPSPMSVARKTGSIDGRASNSVESKSAAIDFADEYEGRDTDSANDARDADFTDAYERYIVATRAICKLAKKTTDVYVAEARLDALIRGVKEVVDDESEVLRGLYERLFPDGEE
ncbi:hypothetical protein V500_05183 [Pseudogymnoascus sp. VKM F-4518 (FW-2643)]|nr:hypothetical protein V500_05183 [Pseudogymnoascus sp. VKM F-4518 (FW-2643)]